MNTAKEMKIVSGLLSLNFDQAKTYINDNITDSLYEAFMARKVMQKLYLNKSFTDDQKSELLQCLMNSFPYHKQDIKACYDFINLFFPASNKIYCEIESLIKSSFQGSLFIFSYCLGMYVQENPDAIFTAKHLILSIAKRILDSDLHASGLRSSLILADSIYTKYKNQIDMVYRKAIKYGAIQEKYDAISFCRERITCISAQTDKPTLSLAIYDGPFELGIQRGAEYDAYLANVRKSDEPGYVHSYYKCIICRYCLLNLVSNEVRECAFGLLNRQYSHISTTDQFYFFTGTIPSYILSIISLLHTELIKLILFSDLNFVIVSKMDVRKNMLWGDTISESDFELCLYLVLNHEIDRGYFLPIDNQEAVLIGKWMYDSDLSVVERAKDVAFDCSHSSELGKSSNIFGKEIFEKIVRGILSEYYGWRVVGTSIKLKSNKRITTDVDLIAYKDGIVVIGQLKVAHCGRNDYQIWKAKTVLLQAIEQSKLSINYFDENPNILYSILKKEKIVACREDINEVIPIVITSSNYFFGLQHESGVTVIGFDMLCEIMSQLSNDQTSALAIRAIKDPSSFYSFNVSHDKIISKIDQEEFLILYEEY